MYILCMYVYKNACCKVMLMCRDVKTCTELCVIKCVYISLHCFLERERDFYKQSISANKSVSANKSISANCFQ